MLGVLRRKVAVLLVPEARIMQEVAQRRVDAARAGGAQDQWAFVWEQNVVNRATGQRAFIDYTLGRNISVP